MKHFATPFSVRMEKRLLFLFLCAIIASHKVRVWIVWYDPLRNSEQEE